MSNSSKISCFTTITKKLIIDVLNPKNNDNCGKEMSSEYIDNFCLFYERFGICQRQHPRKDVIIALMFPGSKEEMYD